MIVCAHAYMEYDEVWSAFIHPRPVLQGGGEKCACVHIFESRHANTTKRNDAFMC